MKRLAVTLVITILLGTSCSGQEDGRKGVLDVRIPLPRPGTTAPAWLVAAPADFDDEDAVALEAVTGVDIVVEVDIYRMRARSSEDERDVSVGAVDPLDYRSVAPPPTKEAEFVWSSLMAGKVVPSFDLAGDLGAEETARWAIRGIGKVSVGAVAENGVPAIADLLVDAALVRDTAPDARLAIIGVARGTNKAKLGRRLAARLPGASMRPIVGRPAGALAPPEPEVVGDEPSAPIAAMSFRTLDDGFIKPSGSWVTNNITTTAVPLIGEVTCHRIMVAQLTAALAEIEQAGLATLIDPAQYGGCYVPRFIDRDPTKPLSMHAFGLALDLNVAENPLGTAGDMDARVVEIFERWGFEWGGAWSRPDPMHFELDRLVKI